MAANALVAPPDDFVLLQTADVALGNLGESDHNTLVLTGIDLVVPLEMDLDGDPLQDDELRLSSEHGFFEQTLSARDAEVAVDSDNRLLLYRFRDVPPGAYRLSVNVAGTFHPLLRSIVVAREGAFVGSTLLNSTLPTNSTQAESTETAGEEDDSSGLDGCGH